ncbi:MAG: hypothetical protein ACRDZX_13900, partial [Acidimicrobiales bacterium]
MDASSYPLAVSAVNPGDLEVLAVVNDTWADSVTSVTGGGVSQWSPAGAPFFDGADGQTLQIWYGTVTSAGSFDLTVAWNGVVENADLAEEEFSAGPRASWSLAAEGDAQHPFPALDASSPGELYFGAAMSWGEAQAGNTPGTSYTVPDNDFMVASDTDASGAVAPDGNGAGSVGALFEATGTPLSAGAVTSGPSGPVPLAAGTGISAPTVPQETPSAATASPPATTGTTVAPATTGTTVAPTTSTTVAPATSTTAAATTSSTAVPATTSTTPPATTSTTLPATTSTSAVPATTSTSVATTTTGPPVTTSTTLTRFKATAASAPSPATTAPATTAPATTAPATTA